MIANNALEIINKERVQATDPAFFNIHEFTLIDNGRNSMWATWKIEYWNPEEFGMETTNANKKVENDGFRVQDVATGQVLFEWYSMDHVSPLESYNQAEAYNKTLPFWDFL